MGVIPHRDGPSNPFNLASVRSRVVRGAACHCNSPKEGSKGGDLSIETNIMAKKLTVSNIQLSHEEIAQHARRLYEQSGSAPGRDVENWLQAEAQLLAARKAAAERTVAEKTGAKSADRR